MDITSLLFLLLLAALGWFWFDSLHALEARTECREEGLRQCECAISRRHGLQHRAGAGAQQSGRRVLRRTYRFEFSETGNSRLEGKILLLGSTVESVTMEPYQILPSDGHRLRSGARP